MKKLVIFLLFTLASLHLFAQAPEAFNYQAVVRNSIGNIVPNQSVSFRIGIRQTSVSGPLMYQETHTSITNNFGLVNLQVGRGSVVTGNFSNINWGASGYYLEVEFDVTGGTSFSVLGTQQLIAVPYALHAKTAQDVDDADANPSNEIQSLSSSAAGTNRTISISGGGAGTSFSVADNDDDAANELNTTFSLNGNLLSLTDPGGTLSVNLSSLNDEDADSTNEIQTLSRTGSDVSLSNSGGTVSINDADADASNELQDLSSSTSGINRTINISGGTGTTISVADNDNSASNELQDLSSSTSGINRTINISGGTGTTISVADNDNNSANELNSNLSLSGTTLSLTDAGGTLTANLGSLSDEDADSTNEYQTITRSGTNLTLSDGGGTVSIADNDNSSSNEFQNLGATSSGTNRTVTITNGTNATFSIADNDNSSSNELQTISKSGNNLTLSNGGGTVSIADNDNNSSNELQTISKSGNNLTLSNGGGTVSVADNDNSSSNELQNLSSTTSGTNRTINISGGTGTTISVADNDNSSSNEFQNLGATSSGTNRTVTITNGTNATFSVADNDNNSSNEIQSLSYSGSTLSLSNGGGSVTISNGDITGVAAGAGLTGGGSSGTPTLTAAANNGLNVDASADRIQLGGALVENTTITQGNFAMTYNMNGTGDFTLQDNGTSIFQIRDDGIGFYGDDFYWRDGNTGGTNLMTIVDDADDGRLRIYENGGTSVDLDANTQFIFNEQGFDRDFRVESDADANMFRVNAGLNRVGISDANPQTKLEIGDAAGQTLMLSRQDGTILSGDQLGGIGFDGSDGNTPDDIREASASIIAFATEDHSTADKGGRLTFWTSPTNQDDDTDGIERLRIDQNGIHYVGEDMYWRDQSVTGTNIARIIDDGDDGQMILYENGSTQILLDANGTTVFNEQGGNRDFRVEGDADANNFRVDASTNRVGVGDGAPVTKLEVAVSTGQSLMLTRLDGTITANEQLGGIGFDGSDGNTPDDIREASASIIAFASEDHGTGDKGGRLTFWTSPTNQDDDTDGIERLRIDQNGTHYVGGDMYWRDNSVSATNIARIIDDGDDGQFLLYENGVSQILLDANGTSVFNEQGLSRDFRIETDTKSNAFYVDGSANTVGVGLNVHDRNFHVQHDQFTGGGGLGGLAIEQSSNGSTWHFYVSQSSSNLAVYFGNTLRGNFDDASGAYTQSSDARLKKNVETIGSTMNRIMQLRPTEYHFNEMSDEEPKIAGLIAQELKQVFPNVVKILDDDTNGNQIPDLHTVSYTELIPYMIKGMQEQQMKIQELEQEVTKLRQQAGSK